MNKALLEQSLRALRHLTQAYDDALFGAGLCANEILDVTEATKALESAIAQPEQEPVQWMHCEDGDTISPSQKAAQPPPDCWYTIPLYTSPQPALKPLSDDELLSIMRSFRRLDTSDSVMDLCRQVEAAVMEKANT